MVPQVRCKFKFHQKVKFYEQSGLLAFKPELGAGFTGKWLVREKALSPVKFLFFFLKSILGASNNPTGQE